MTYRIHCIKHKSLPFTLKDSINFEFVITVVHFTGTATYSKKVTIDVGIAGRMQAAWLSRGFFGENFEKLAYYFALKLIRNELVHNGEIKKTQMTYTVNSTNAGEFPPDISRVPDFDRYITLNDLRAIL